MRVARQNCTVSLTRLKISTFVAALIIGLVAPMLSRPSHTRADASDCKPDTLNLAAASWLTGMSGAVNVCSPDEGPTNVCLPVTGAPADPTHGCTAGQVWSGTEWQCVELINRLYLTKGWISATWYGNGGGTGGLIAHLPASLSSNEQANGAISFLNPGDVITLNNDNDPNGHAGVIDTVTTAGGVTTANIINQNAQLNSSAKIVSGSLSAGTATLNMNAWLGYHVQAIVHHPNSVAPQAPGLGGGNASSWGVGRLDGWVEQATPTGGSNLGHVYFDAASWQPWETIPSTQLMASQPAAVSWGVNRVDVFARGQAGDLVHDWFDSAGWHNWESLGGCLVGSPTVTSWGASRLDVLAQGCESAGTSLWHRPFDGTAWQPWETVVTSAALTASPSAVSWGQGRIDVFSRGTDTSLIHTWFDATGWHPWESLGGCIVGSPAAASWGSGRVDAWAQGCSTTGANFWHTWYDSTGWHPWELISSTQQIAGVLGATSWGPNRIDLFTRNADNTMSHWYYSGSWAGPEQLGGSLAP